MEITLINLIITLIVGGASVTGVIAVIANRYMNKWTSKIETMEGRLLGQLREMKLDMTKHEERIHKLHVEVEGRVSRVEEQIRWQIQLLPQIHRHRHSNNQDDDNES